jgi:hypothetical protein
MPPRFVILAIIAFWLATTAWLIYRDVLPPLQSGDPPPYSIDLADEVSAQTISWRVLRTGEEIGTVRTVVRRQPDRTFALEGDFRPLKALEILVIDIKQLRSRYTVTRGGDLRTLATQLQIVAGGKAIEVVVDGKVDNGMFTPLIRVEGTDVTRFPLLNLRPVPVGGNGNVLNPMHPLNRLRGLRAGQHWVQPVFDPLLLALSSRISQLPLRQLSAEVMPGTLTWNGAEVLCWKINIASGKTRSPPARGCGRRTAWCSSRKPATPARSWSSNG